MADVYLGSVYAKLELKTDELKKSIDSAERTISNLGNTVSSSASSFDSVAKSAERASTSASNSFGNMSRTVSRSMSDTLNSVADGFDRVAQSVSGLDSFLTRMTAGLATAATSVATVGVKGGLALGQQIEDAQTGLTFILKSSDKAAQVMERVRKEAERTPFDVGNLSSLTQQLATFTKDGDKAVDVLMAMGSATVASGRGVEDLERAAVNLGQAFNNAWSFADYRQMLNAVPMFKTVADEYGLTWEKMQQIQKSGTQNLGEELTRIFTLWGEQNDVFAYTANNLSQLKASFSEVFEGAFYDALKSSGAFDQVKNTIVNLRDAMENNKGVIADLFKEISSFISQIDVNALVGTAVGMIRGLVSGLKVLGSVIKTVATILGGGDFNKGIEVFSKILVYSTLATKGIKLFANTGSAITRTMASLFSIGGKVSGVFGKLGKSTGALAKNMGGGVGSSIGAGIAGVLKPLGNTEVLKGAASVALVSVGLVLIAKALGDAMKIDYDLGKLLAFSACVTAAAGIMALIGTFGAYAIIGGIATAVIGGGLLVAAIALEEVTKSADLVDLGSLTKFSGTLAVVSIILATISGFAVFGAIAAIASGVIGAGLLVAAKCLAEASKSVKDIDMDQITKFSGMLSEVSVILGLISGFAIFGAISSVANMIISGGLLVAAIALKETSERVKDIDSNALVEFSGTLAVVDTILGLMSGFAVLGAIGAVANDIIAGGLLVAAIALRETSNVAKGVDKDQIYKLNEVIAVTDTILAAMSLFSVFAGIGAIMTDVITGGVLVAAKALLEATKYAKQLKSSDLNKLESMLQKIASWDTGGLLGNLKNMINTGVLTQVADNVKSVVSTLSGLQPISNETIDSLNSNIKKLSELQTSGVLDSIGQMWSSGNLKEVASNVRSIMEDLSGIKSIPDEGAINSLKDAVYNLSKIKIEGSGLFENKGGAAQELRGIVVNIRGMADDLASMPQIDYGKVESNVNAIKLFDRIDDNARNGFRRLNDLGDSLGNINWIKSILGDLPDDIYGKVQWFVDSIKLFDRIDDNARNGMIRLNSLGDSLGNIDWIKHILGDLPTDIYGKVQWFVDSIKLFDRIDENARNGVLRLSGMRDALGNIDWIKHILGDIPQDISTRAGELVNAISKFNGISVDSGNLQNVANALNSLVNSIKNQMGQLVSVMTQSGVQSSSAFVNGFTSKIGDARVQGVAMGNSLKSGLQSVNGSLNAVGQAAQGQYWRGIQGKMNDEYQQGKALGTQFRQGLYDIDYGNAGWWATQGFINGANSHNVYSVGWQIANKFLQGLKDRGQQGSPWKTTFQSGKWAGEGFADGIKKSEGMVERAANAVADVAISAMNMSQFDDVLSAPDMIATNASISALNNRVEPSSTDNSTTTNIYGDIHITPNGDDEEVLEELSRATTMTDRGMATRV